MLVETLPKAEPAFLRPRHFAIAATFGLFVIVPAGLTALYLSLFASDQYSSTLGFSVRAENTLPVSDLVGSLIGTASNGARDSDILYEYMRGQEIVSLIDQKLDLRAVYSKPQNDPVFSLADDASIETLAEYWTNMTLVSFDSNAGLIEAEIRSFSAEDSLNIAQAVLDLSSHKINELSNIAREDSIRFARETLDVTTEQLRTARTRLTAFRIENQMIDPQAAIQGQMGLLNSLQTQLAEEIITNDLIRLSTTRDTDPRIEQSDRRISIIRNRIEEERSSLGAGVEGSGPPYSQIVSEYEGLTVDREFAEERYLAARANYDVAVAEADRQSRYLVVYNPPTLAETPTHPRRFLIFALTTLLLVGIWSLATMIFYSIKDRR
ncbi:sugar transporter [Celeribacter baekdonensis]|uniref:sugar transporter n=1 Tax=Celeribacter baekdonensis TaxID=875171 RepID=UPI003A8E402C